MLDRKLSQQAWSLGWRFMLTSIALSYPFFSYMNTMIENAPKTGDGLPEIPLMLLGLNLIVPLVIPFVAMYVSLAWYQSRGQHVVS